MPSETVVAINSKSFGWSLWKRGRSGVEYVTQAGQGMLFTEWTGTCGICGAEVQGFGPTIRIASRRLPVDSTGQRRSNSPPYDPNVARINTTSCSNSAPSPPGIRTPRSRSWLKQDQHHERSQPPRSRTRPPHRRGARAASYHPLKSWLRGRFGCGCPSAKRCMQYAFRANSIDLQKQSVFGPVHFRVDVTATPIIASLNGGRVPGIGAAGAGHASAIRI